ncbi:hypothetical protein [Methanosarcina horonobensis]|uniref:hypothetical protein n=1 Tax=Methanosarcina horonobensis TaxID=418008 RepID=UPI0022B8839A|nr:hypothetical protein [Methanosarcina horonobensis]
MGTLFFPGLFSGKGKMFLTAFLALMILALAATFLGASEVLENIKQVSLGSLALASLVYCASWRLEEFVSSRSLKD